MPDIFYHAILCFNMIFPHTTKLCVKLCQCVIIRCANEDLCIGFKLISCKNCFILYRIVGIMALSMKQNSVTCLTVQSQEKE